MDEAFQDVSDLRQGGAWNDILVDHIFPENIAHHIKQNVVSNGNKEHWDIPY